MLVIYSVSLELIRTLAPRIRDIEHHDADLARQFKRALSSISLNIAEGSYSRGKNSIARFHTALGSARESLACLEVAASFGYLDDPEPTVRERFDHVIGALVRLVR